jgi:hypothetical protein
MSILSLRDAALDLSSSTPPAIPRAATSSSSTPAATCTGRARAFPLSVLARDADGKPFPKPLPVT